MSEIKNATIDDIVELMKKNNRKSDIKLIRRTYEFAKFNHGDQIGRAHV